MRATGAAEIEVEERQAKKVNEKRRASERCSGRENGDERGSVWKVGVWRQEPTGSGPYKWMGSYALL